LWTFHRIHHSDELMNASTWARDHFLQNSWRAFFSIFTLGLIVDLDLSEAGKAALYSNIFLMALSMFCHSAIRVQIPWLDRVLVTPQVHRIHHGVDPAYHNKNFADALPIFDIVFGTYHRPGRGEFPRTGLGQEFPAPRSLWSAQFGPLAAIAQMLPRRQGARVKPPSGA
jgi:sterol desaturase/sphingolipid hydroxylase (fatty acid hydroxylase superfamily)